MQLDPHKLSSVSLPNASWGFILGLLENTAHGVMVKNGQAMLHEMISAGIAEANKPPPVEVTDSKQ
jgi:hypothetical protein